MILTFFCLMRFKIIQYNQPRQFMTIIHSGIKQKKEDCLQSLQTVFNSM